MAIMEVCSSFHCGQGRKTIQYKEPKPPKQHSTWLEHKYIAREEITLFLCGMHVVHSVCTYMYISMNVCINQLPRPRMTLRPRC